MSIKKYFDRAQNLQALANKSAEDIAGQVESVGYHEQDIIDEERFIPRVDFSDPANFARYGSAKEYYDQTIKRIYNEYPYDGSLRERLEWRNESNYLDLYVFDNLYPRTNGHIILSALGGATSALEDGYGNPSTPEYILVKGGPNSHPEGSTPSIKQFTGSNYYEPDKNRGSNLEFDLATRGATVEFWLNKSEFVISDTEREVVFDLWNGQLSSSSDYFRFRVELSASGPATGGESPFLVTILSGTTGVFRQPVAASGFTTASVADGNWHHYALTLASASAGIETKFYVDGNLNNSTTLGSNGINNTLHNGFRAHIGALITNISGNAYGASTMAGYGKLSGSIDEFRYWKKRRTSQEIGRFWFTQVGGGVNTDPTPFTTNQETANVDLGVYYKFNEGITGRTATDSTVLDYSGRFSNGAWTGYNTSARNTGSAIVLSTAATSEFQDPIIYSFHPDVVTLTANLDLSGSSHDGYNNASIYKTIPSWIAEQDAEGEKNVKYLTQIISSYFDTLHLQIDSLNKLKNIEYPSGSQKPLPFGERLLSGYGFVAPDIFVDADVLEVLADRSEDRVYEKSLHDIKNIIYQNIYNNLNYIYKSKGTEKAFRNLIRCFGIDDELVKINSYANNIQYEMRNNRRNVVSADRYANFNSGGNTDANVYNFTDASNANSVGFIPATADLFNGYATTLETEVLFPLKRESNTVSYVDTNTISASLFGIHGANSDGTETTWNVEDYVNFQVYAVKDEIDSTNAKFVLTGTTHGLVPSLESDLYQDVYNNKRWNLSVRVKPSEYPFKSLVSVTSSNYVVELHGVHAEAGEILDEFTVSGTVSAPNMGFLTGSRRAYVGAHRTNFTGTLLQSSDVKVNACRFWLDSLSDQTLRGHILDTENHGALQPDLYAFPFNTSASAGDVRKIDTLVFNWEFLNNTGSDSNGRFTVDDISSGSAAFTRFGDLSTLLNRQYSARGDNFTPSSTTAIDKDFVMSSRLNLPENVQSEDMIRVLTAQEQDVFTNESRPVNYFFAFEKSMAQVISEEIINYFADLTTFHNLIGAPVNKYREEYKEIKLLRNRFFEKVGNTEIDFDRFYEFYKWFDTSMSIMLNQLVPASAEFSDSVRTIIESHALERSKYKNIFPFLERKGAIDITGSIDGQNIIDASAGGSPDDFPAGTQLFSNTAYTKRQIGSSRVNQTTTWKFYHAPPTANKAAPTETENQYWHKYREERALADRTAIHGVITQSYDRVTHSPIKFSVEGAVSLGGVGKHPAYKPNYVFNATEPHGTIGANTAPENIMVVSGSDVEKLVETSDVYYPNLRQRLGFKMKPGINSGEDNAFDGNMYAPFSLYSSSVATGYNSTVVSEFTSSIEITNLHNDFVVGADKPLQGPFTEKYVGGRAYRHTALNDGTDTVATRAEGFRIQFENVTASDGTTFNDSLAVLPPNNLGGATDSSIPTAARFRDETAKRPVNIRNIRMTTGSTVIGNYEKNYQVIQTAGRTQNDPFFNDQSFDFAPYPETLATRGRFPLYEPVPIAGKSFNLGNGASSPQNVELVANGTTISEWNDLIGSASTGAKPYSMTWWMYVNTWSGMAATPVIAAIGQSTYGTGREIRLIDDTHMDGFRSYPGWNGYRQNATNMSTGVWYHCATTYAGMGESYAGTAVNPDVYLNGALDNGNVVTPVSVEKVGIIDRSVLRVGHNDIGSNAFFNGHLCDVTIYNKELTADEITEIYNGGIRSNPLQSSVASNVIVYYPMGNDPGDDVTSVRIVDLGADNLGGFSGTTNLEMINVTSSAAISSLSPSNLPVEEFEVYSSFENLPTNNPGGLLNYALPERTGSASNKTVIVNRYAGSGYEVMSLGYMDPAHEELSVYNAAPYHNLSIINHGLSGSASVDPLEAKTIAVVDHLNKNRGLNQRATLHAGPYGIDAAYGSISPDSYGYPTQPSWHKTNRNRKRRPELLEADITASQASAATAVYVTGSTFDNLYVQHAIPRSEQQYAWVTSSIKMSSSADSSNAIIYGLDNPSCFSGSSMDKLIISGSVYEDLSFMNLTTKMVDPVSGSEHIQGFPLTTDASTMRNQDYIAEGANGGLQHLTDYFNFINTSRNGPYGFPMWKQIRVGETKVARVLRHKNRIGTVIRPKKIENIINGNLAGLIQPTRPNTFADYFEPPVDSRNKPIVFSFEDNTENSNPENNIIVSVPYGNDIEYFNNNGLNNRLGLTVDMDRRRSYHSVRDFALESNLSVVVNYGERIYPSAENAYKPAIRARQNFVINTIWDDNRTDRSLEYGLSHTSSTGFNVSGASTWPLDAHLDFSLLHSLTASDGAGELMSLGARFTSGAWGNGVDGTTGFDTGDLLLRNDGTEGIYVEYTETTASACYAMRVYAGYKFDHAAQRQPRPIFAGDVPWVAPAQAGKVPYKPYVDFSDKLSRLGKDYSLVPEFRSSTLMATYLNDKSGDFTDEVDQLFNLTGASIADSSGDDFYTIYSNGDFLKYFKFIDDDLYDKRSGDLKIVRDKIELSCDAMINFLPYKGFYPAERTLELSTLFSQSFADSTLSLAKYFQSVGSSSATLGTGFDPQSFRIAMEPLYAPGIMFNTIKSGISVSNYVIVDVSCSSFLPLLESPFPDQSLSTKTAMHMYQSTPTHLPEGMILYGMGTGSSNFQGGVARPLAASSSCPILAIASGSNETAGKMIKKVPFEVLQRPADFFNVSSLSKINGTEASPTALYLLDTGPSGSHHWNNSWLNVIGSFYTSRSNLMFTNNPVPNGYAGTTGDFVGGKLYELAIDNFLCETTNFFMLGPSNFQSTREENFKTVQSGTTYSMKLDLFRSANTASALPDNKKFEMYSRASAFGAPLAGTNVSNKVKDGSTVNFGNVNISFSHVTPPYYAGSGSAIFSYTARYDGKPSLDEILSETIIDFSRKELVANKNAENAKVANRDRPSERGDGLNEDFRVQLDSCFNLLDKIQEVPTGSTEIKNRWLIQSKFETPILNFAGVSTGSQFLPVNDTIGGATQARDVVTRGMWHQYGSLLTGSDIGVFATVSDVGENSLADIVGFEKGIMKRVGAVRTERIVKEAVVAVPFKTIDGERRFIDLPLDNPEIDYTRSNTYKKMAQALDTYVFPPKFDFKRFGSVNPVLMYVFEFSVTFTQKDLADMWQNLPPDLERRFERQNAVVEERELIDLITSKNEDIEWMVFKVKQRAEKDYDRFRRSLVTNDVSSLPVRVRSPLTYNWPYDYFSIVELARIEESAQYVSTDIKKLAPVSDLERLDIQRTPISGSGISERQRRQNQSRNPRSRTPQIEEAPATETTRYPQRVAPRAGGAPRTEQTTLPTAANPTKKNKKGR